MSEKKDVKSLADRIKALKIVSLNNVNYLCQLEKTKDEVKFTEALEVGSRDFENVVREWIKRDNIGTLESFDISGTNYTLATKPFNEEHVYLIDSVSAKASYLMSKALKKLENDSF